MSRYNSPPNAAEYIESLAKRIKHLETFRRQTVLTPILARKVSEYDTPVNVTSTSFVDTYVFFGVIAATKPRIYIEVLCSDSTTSGEWQLVDGMGTVLTDRFGVAVPPKSIPVNTTSYTLQTNDQDPGYYVDSALGERYEFRLQVKRVAGTGTISVKARQLLQVPG